MWIAHFINYNGVAFTITSEELNSVPHEKGHMSMLEYIQYATERNCILVKMEKI